MGYFKNLLIQRMDEQAEQSSIPQGEIPETEIEDDGWDSFRKEEQLRDSMEEEEN